MKKTTAALAPLIFAALAAQARAADIIVGDTPGETYTVPAGTVLEHTGNIAVIGTGSFVLQGQLRLTGHLYVTGSGAFTADGGTLHIQGNDTHILVDSDGRLAFRNGAALHYVQTYVGQHYLTAWGRGRIEMDNASVDCDGSSETIVVRENAAYAARDVSAPDWKTWYLYDSSTLSLENFTIGGDIVYYDRPAMTFVNCTGIMPWMHFDAGAVVDASFPAPSSPADPVTRTIDGAQPGFSGIPWSLSIRNCTYVAWGINPYPGSSVTIRDSWLQMILFRFAGPGQQSIQGTFRNGSFCDDTTVPVADRTLRLVRTRVQWWKVDVMDGFQLAADSISFSEMMVFGASTARLTNSTCEGQTIHLGAVDQAYVEFERGEVWTYVSAWDDAVMVLRDSLVDFRKGAYRYQTRNIAHHRARLYALNTAFGYETDPSESEPEAQDEALAMFLFIDAPAAAAAGAAVEVRGSAWIKSGPSSPVLLSQWRLEAAPAGTSDWTLLRESSTSERDAVLKTWDTAGLAPGDYRLRLTLWTNGDTGNRPTHDYPAERAITLAAPGDGGHSGGHCGATGAEVLPLLLYGLFRSLRRRSSRARPSDGFSRTARP